MGKLLLVALTVASLIPVAPGAAHTSWSVSGEIETVSLHPGGGIGCTSPTCVAFSQTCDLRFGDTGIDFSIKRLPAGAAGHRARFTYTYSQPPRGTDTETDGGGYVALFFFDHAASSPTAILPCRDFPSRRLMVRRTPYEFTVPPEAKYVGSGGFLAVGLSWTMKGIDH